MLRKFKDKEKSDAFEVLFKKKLENLNKIKGIIKKEEKVNSDLNTVDSDKNLESYYNYAVEVVSFFYMVSQKLIFSLKKIKNQKSP